MELTCTIISIMSFLMILPRPCMSYFSSGEGSDSDEFKYKLQKLRNVKPEKHDVQYGPEKNAGDPADVFASNPHYRYPEYYTDFSRRFVPVYPYTEKKPSKTNGESQENRNREIIPIKSSPEKVIQVAMQSALEAALNPPNDTESVKKEDMLRSGDYWNSVWVEDVDPKNVLRTYKNKHSDQDKKYRSSVPKLISALLRSEVPPQFRFINFPEYRYELPRTRAPSRPLSSMPYRRRL